MKSWPCPWLSAGRQREPRRCRCRAGAWGTCGLGLGLGEQVRDPLRSHMKLSLPKARDDGLETEVTWSEKPESEECCSPVRVFLASRSTCGIHADYTRRYRTPRWASASAHCDMSTFFFLGVNPSIQLWPDSPGRKRVLLEQVEPPRNRAGARFVPAEPGNPRAIRLLAENPFNSRRCICGFC